MAIDWDALYELAPSDLTYVKDTDDAIRSLKTATRERITKEHEFDLAGQARQGLHRAGSAVAFYQATAPTQRNGVNLAVADAGLLFVDSDDVAAQVWTGTAFAGLKGAQSTNLTGGLIGQIPYQSAVNVTAFLAAGTASYVLTGNGAAAPVWTPATNANTASTIVKRDASGNFSAGIVSAALTGTASLATSLVGGGAGQLPYQSGAGVTAMLTAGTTSQLLKGGTAPSWQTMASVNTASAVVQRDASGNFSAGTISAALTGTAALATALAGGTAGQMPYQSGAGVTAFIAAGTAGYVLTGAGTGTPTWTSATEVNTASTIVRRDASGNFAAGTITAALTGNASTATNLNAGTAGQLPYQSGANTTAFIAAGTAGYVLTGAGTSVPVWTEATNANTASTIVKRDASGNFAAGTVTAALTGNASTATTTTHLASGAAGSIPYQSGSGVTAFLAAGTTAQVLKGGTTPSWLGFASANTASTLVQRNASGDFSAGTITAALTGNVTGTASVATGVTVAQVSDNVSYPIALVESAGAGTKGIKTDTSSGTYNPSTNTAAISVTGNAGSVGGVHTTVLDIGDWNMDINIDAAVLHGLTASKIRSVSALIRKDDDSIMTMLLPFGRIEVAPTSVDLFHDGTFFSTADYDSTSFNRGYVVIQHVD